MRNCRDRSKSRAGLADSPDSDTMEFYRMCEFVFPERVDHEGTFKRAADL